MTASEEGLYIVTAEPPSVLRLSLSGAGVLAEWPGGQQCRAIVNVATTRPRTRSGIPE